MSGVPNSAVCVSQRGQAVLAVMMTLCVVWGGVFGGREFLPRQFDASQQPLLETPFGAWDGVPYVDIAQNGYWYTPEAEVRSNIVFFPGYPLAGRVFATLTGLPVRWALPILSQILFAACVLLLASDLSHHRSLTNRETEWCVWTFAFWPAGIFFRMTHSESLFLFLVLLAMWGMRHGWSATVVACLVGCSTGVRSVGVGVSIVYWLWLLRGRTWTSVKVLSTLFFVLLSLWGLIAFVVFQSVAFGNGLAFVEVQEQFRRRPSLPLLHQLEVLLGLEPIWSVYDPSSGAYWRIQEVVSSPWLSLKFANPLVFVLTCGLVYFGWKQVWLTREESLLGALLLAIPYVTHGDQGCMLSMARYCSVVYPAFIVLGIWLSRRPWWMRLAALCVCTVYLGLYSAMFAAWYPVY